MFRNLSIPISNMLGGEAGVRQGTETFHHMMVPERMTSAAQARL